MKARRQSRFMKEFRAGLKGDKPQRSRPGVPLRELLVIVGLLMTMGVLFILLGGHRWWAASWAYACAGLTLLMLFIPLGKDSLVRLPSTRPVENLKSLLKFPVFWLGALLMVYVWIQSQNVAWVLTFPPGSMQLKPVSHIEWLPSGMQTLLEAKNPFRYLMIFGTAWLWTCALWVGVRTRRGFFAVLNGLAVMSFCWGALAIFQFMYGMKKILGIWEVSLQMQNQPRPFYGTLVNVNHSGALLMLGAGLALALFFHYRDQSRRKGQSGGPHLVFLTITVFMLFIAIMTFSRAVIGMVVAFFAFFILLIIVDNLIQRSWRALTATVGIVLFIGSSGAWLAWEILDRDQFVQEWHSIFEVIKDPQKDVRIHISEATIAMMKARQPYGWGAGGFSYYFPAYQQSFPKSILYAHVRYVDPETKRVRWKKVPSFFRYAHNDWIQYPLELGYVGAGILGAILLFWLGAAGRWIRNLRLQHLALYGALVLVLLQAWVEFHFQIAVVHVMFAALVVIGVKWQSMTMLYTPAEIRRR